MNSAPAKNGEFKAWVVDREKGRCVMLWHPVSEAAAREALKKYL